MPANPALTVLQTDTLPFEERAARVLGVASLPPLPTPRVEEWHFTNLRPILALKPHRDTDWNLTHLARCLPVVEGPQVVLVGGRVVPQLTLLSGLAKGLTVRWDGLHAPLPAHGPLDNWHAAQGGQVLEVVAEGDALLHIIHVLPNHDTPSGGTVSLKVHGGNLNVVEHFVAPPASMGWANSRLVAQVAEGTTLTHTVFQTMPTTACQTRRADITVADNATYNAFCLQVGSALSRLETHITAAQNGHVGQTTLALTGAGQTHDTTFRLTHTHEATTSNIRQRNILRAANAHAVFQGKFYVAQKAQKTDAYMLCESLLLAEGARISAKPELEIYADDVKCSHGASTGSLNTDQVFYLAARGMPPEAAKRLLVEAFAEALLADAPPHAQPMARTLVSNWLDNKPIGPPPADDPEPDTSWLS